MRIVRFHFEGWQHEARSGPRTDSVGNALFTCNCGRSGWGMRGLTEAHRRPAPQPVVRTQNIDPDAPRFWNPMFDTREERRAHILYNYWAGTWHLRRGGRLRTRLVEAAACWYAGHQESATVPGVCYFCQKRRPRRTIRTWKPAPERDPQLRPGERPAGRPPSVVPVVWGCKPHAKTNCPYCTRRSR